MPEASSKITVQPITDATPWARQHCSGCDRRGDYRLTFDSMYLSLCADCAGLLRGLLPEPEPAQRPPFPADGICPVCSSDNDWQVQEAGYMRFTTAQMEPDHDGDPYLAAFPNGSSDYSEDGDDQWVTCVSTRCENDQDGAIYDVPEHLVFG